MRLIVKIVVFIANLLAFLVILSVGVLAAGVAESGVRLPGALLALAALIAFGCAAFLIFRPAPYFRTQARKVMAGAAALAALAPVALLSFFAFEFAGIPVGTNAPMVDWGAFLLGIMFLIGSLGIVALGYRRVTERPTVQERYSASPHASERADETAPQASYGMRDDVRVTRV